LSLQVSDEPSIVATPHAPGKRASAVGRLMQMRAERHARVA
jgi:hypothetical protein